VPLPVEALLEPALTDDAIVRAFRLQRHPEFLAERAEGEAAGNAKARAEREAKGLAGALLIVLAGRGIDPTEGERQLIVEERDLGRLQRWLAAAGTCANFAELLALP
jgi:hypothetical protein